MNDRTLRTFIRAIVIFGFLAGGIFNFGCSDSSRGRIVIHHDTHDSDSMFHVKHCHGFGNPDCDRDHHVDSTQGG